MIGVNTLEYINLIVTDNKEYLIDWAGVDFGYQWTYGDNEPIDGYVYIDFVIW